ncbi:MAG TPA: hypothetical protein VEY87_13750 [Gaiellaceae bacterium]|nr:hypothetical protein [Gaiellaceae bacterium]
MRAVAAERCLLERLAQLVERLVDGGRARVPQLSLREAARHEADRLEASTPGGLHVPRRVADHDGLARPCLREGSLDEVRVGLRRLDVVLRRPPVDDVPHLELVEQDVEMLLHRRACEHDDVATLLQGPDEPLRARQRRDLVDHLVEELLPPVAQGVAQPLLHVVVGDGRDELVAAHPDVPMQPPDGDYELLFAEGAVPREGVVVVRVGERAVDVEDRRGPGHYDRTSPQASAGPR